MKNLLSLILLFSLFVNCSEKPKNSMVMCHDPNSPTVLFASLSNDPNFRAAHVLRDSIKPDFAGEMVEFPCVDEKNGKAYLVRKNAESNQYLLLFHEWWGLNAFVKSEADYWANELGINVLALDLYDGAVADNPDQAGKLMRMNNAERSHAIIFGAMNFAGEKADFRTMGWCFGGGWSLQAALLIDQKLKGCVMFYGMPESNTEKLSALKSDVIFIHATADKWINDRVVQEFEANMATAGKSLTVHRFEADHAFANPSSPRFNEKSATEARKVVKTYLDKTLKG